MTTVLEQMKDVLSTRNVGRTVRSECKKCMAYIDANKLRIGNTYFNQFTVDLYFTRDVVNQNGQINTINHIINSLQWMWIIETDNLNLLSGM